MPTATRRPAHTTGMVPVHPASERLRPQRIREWAWQALPLARHASSRCPRGLAQDRWPRVATP